jgi:glycosyltransferase involved in cell wall biosynthesis
LFPESGKMNKKIRVLEIINNAVIGGGPIHVLLILKNINREIFEPWSICSKEGDLITDFEEYSAQHHYISISKKPNIFSVIKLYRLIKQNDIQMVHTHGGVAGLWGRFAAFFVPGVKTVYTLHGIHYLNYKSTVLRYFHILIERFWAKFTDAIICVADSEQRKANENRLFPPEKGVIIRYGIDFKPPAVSGTDLMNFKKSIGCDENTTLLLNVARLHRQKGQPWLLEAYRDVVREIPNTRLLIVGDGPERAAIGQQIRELKLTEQVLLLGFRQDVHDLLAFADIFVLSSLWEGLPLAIIEAMGMGKPIVSTNVDGIAEIIEDQQQGLLVAPRDSQGLAQAMLKMLQNRDLAQQLGRAAQKKVLKMYDIDTMTRNIEHLYLKLIQDK